MHYQGNRLSVTFNGEIYNYLDLRDQLKAKGYQFSSQSDTEVLLAAYAEWGTDCLAHLNGMFAIALYDDEKKLLSGSDASKATVTGKIIAHGRNKKVTVLKFKKTNQYKISRGHRQNYTAVQVSDIKL